MTSNVGSDPGGRGPTFFPASAPAFPSLIAPSAANAPAVSLTERVKAVGGLDRVHLKTATRDEMEQTLQGLVGALKNKSKTDLEAGERHEDGSLRIPSHLAVWLIGKVTEAYGAQLVRLSKISSRESLRSIAALAELLTKAIENDLGAGSR